MTPREIAIALAFERVTFPPASGQKLFAHNMIFLARNSPERALSERQARYLTTLAYRFRRQMPAELAYPTIDDGSSFARSGIETSLQSEIKRPPAASQKKRARQVASPSLSSQLPLL